MESLMRIITEKKLITQFAFCITVLALLITGIYFYIGSLSMRDFASCFFFLFCFYTGLWLCQKWFLRKKTIRFLIYTGLTCIIIAILWWLIVRHVFNHPFAGFFELSVADMPFFIIGLVVGIAAKLFRASITKQVHDAEIAIEQRKTELNLLQSQLSPHFLFNTLNNMYSISIVQHELIPGLLLKLSELLRYSVYSTKQSFLPITEELAYINNYIDFEKIRIGERLLLNIEMDEINEQAAITIPPMLFVIFIENAFKHAKNTFDQKIHIVILLKVKGSFMEFSVKNSHNSFKDENRRFVESSGIGLANTIKRLELLYGNDYQLRQSDENGFYTVWLRLKIK